MRRRKLVRDTMILTAATLLMRSAAMAFQAWLAAHIGAAGVGLYQLVGSVSVLFAAFAISGIRFATVRLVAEEVGLQRGGGVRGAMRRCLGYAVLFGCAAGVVVYLLAEPIGFLWVGDARTVLSLRITAFSMPCIALTSVFSGYFTACGRSWKAAAVQLAQQLLGVACVVALLRRAAAGDLEQICAAITGGGVAADVAALLGITGVYLRDRGQWKPTRGETAPQLTRRMLTTALPLAVSAYTRTALSTFEHMLIPRGLKNAGLSADAALAGYGVVHGMALPAVLFPACLLFALADLLVPELTAAQVSGRTGDIRRMVQQLLGRTLCYALVTAAGMLLLAEPIANTFFHTPEAAQYIRLLAPLVPIMNLDTVTDGCLRGLGMQTEVMLINILDAGLGVLFVWTLLPRLGLTGYLVSIWLTESINFSLSFTRLYQAALRKKADAGSSASA